MFIPLNSWWNSIQSRNAGHRYGEKDAQFFIDQITLRLNNQSLFYSKIWWDDFDSTIHSMSNNIKVQEWSSLLFNTVKLDPTLLFRSLIENREAQRKHWKYSEYKEMGIYDYADHDLWRLVFYAMTSSGYQYLLPSNDPLWSDAWMYQLEWLNQSYYENNLDTVSLLLLKYHRYAHVHYALDAILYNILNSENTIRDLEPGLYSVMNESEFDHFKLKQKPGFAKTFLEWHNYCSQTEWNLSGSHKDPNRVAYLLRHFFPNEWTYLDTCNAFDVPQPNMLNMLCTYFKDPSNATIELPPLNLNAVT